MNQSLLIFLSFISTVYMEYPSWPWDYRWECSGDKRNDTCIAASENTPWFHKWGDNFFCVKKSENLTDPGMEFSRTGPIANKLCINTKEAASPWGWQNNYLCFNHDVPYNLKWHHMGCDKGKACIQWLEPNSPLEESWRDNYLCGEPWPNNINRTFKICSRSTTEQYSFICITTCIIILANLLR